MAAVSLPVDVFCLLGWPRLKSSPQISERERTDAADEELGEERLDALVRILAGHPAAVVIAAD